MIDIVHPDPKLSNISLPYLLLSKRTYEYRHIDAAGSHALRCRVVILIYVFSLQEVIFSLNLADILTFLMSSPASERVTLSDRHLALRLTASECAQTAQTCPLT